MKEEMMEREREGVVEVNNIGSVKYVVKNI
jgi:hypothetical protein